MANTTNEQLSRALQSLLGDGFVVDEHIMGLYTVGSYRGVTRDFARDVQAAVDGGADVYQAVAATYPMYAERFVDMGAVRKTDTASGDTGEVVDAAEDGDTGEVVDAAEDGDEGGGSVAEESREAAAERSEFNWSGSSFFDWGFDPDNRNIVAYLASFPLDERMLKAEYLDTLTGQIADVIDLPQDDTLKKTDPLLVQMTEAMLTEILEYAETGGFDLAGIVDVDAEAWNAMSIHEKASTLRDQRAFSIPEVAKLAYEVRGVGREKAVPFIDQNGVTQYIVPGLYEASVNKYGQMAVGRVLAAFKANGLREQYGVAALEFYMKNKSYFYGTSDADDIALLDEINRKMLEANPDAIMDKANPDPYYNSVLNLGWDDIAARIAEEKDNFGIDEGLAILRVVAPSVAAQVQIGTNEFADAGDVQAAISAAELFFGHNQTAANYLRASVVDLGDEQLTDFEKIGVERQYFQATGKAPSDEQKTLIHEALLARKNQLRRQQLAEANPFNNNARQRPAGEWAGEYFIENTDAWSPVHAPMSQGGRRPDNIELEDWWRIQTAQLSSEFGPVAQTWNVGRNVFTETGSQSKALMAALISGEIHPNVAESLVKSKGGTW